MKSSTTSTQAPCDCPDGQDIALSRPRYFPRQLITPEEMTLEANYFREMFRRMRRLLWGPGVACGVKVTAVTKAGQPVEPGNQDAEPWKALVTSGYVFGPYGDEIVITSDQIVDLRGTGVTGISGETFAGSAEPWSGHPTATPAPGNLYIAVKYTQVMTRPVRAQPVGCGCDDAPCEYSRFSDGYELGILTTGPDPNQTTSPGNPEGFSSKDVCPDWPSSPWVYLAKVALGEGGVIANCDNASVRRTVVSFS